MRIVRRKLEGIRVVVSSRMAANRGQWGGVERFSGFRSPDMLLRMLMLHAFEGEIKMSAQMAPSPVWNDSPCLVRDPRTRNIVVLHFAIHRSRTRPAILARVVAALSMVLVDLLPLASLHLLDAQQRPALIEVPFGRRRRCCAS